VPSPTLSGLAGFDHESEGGEALSDLGFVPPSTPLEERLAEIWARVLRLERVGIHDNLHALSGRPSTATKVLRQVRETFGIELSPDSFFEQPTIAGQAVIIAQSLAEKMEREAEAQALAELREPGDKARECPTAPSNIEKGRQ